MIIWNQDTVVKYFRGSIREGMPQVWDLTFRDRTLYHRLTVHEQTGNCVLFSSPTPTVISLPLLYFTFHCRVIDEIPAHGSDTCIGFYVSEVRTPENLVLSIYKEDDRFFSIYPRTMVPPSTGQPVSDPSGKPSIE